MDLEIKSIVFPRNQMDSEYIESLSEQGVAIYRRIENNWIYNHIHFTPLLRALRLIDAYLPISGSNCHDVEYNQGVYITTGSRLFRPYSHKLSFFESLKLRRIKKQMLYAAKKGKVFHLWWHPHNFSTYTEENMYNLEMILKYYNLLKDKYGFQSNNMYELTLS